MRPYRAAVLAVLLVHSAFPSRASAATMWKVYYPEQSTATGFYDATPTAPVGGNLGTTLGEQRRIAFEKALSIWAEVLSSSVPFVIEARMTALSCDANGAVLGQASAASAVALSATAAARELVYPVALANALDGSDLETASATNQSGAEIFAEFNSELGKADCLDGTSFYFGLDGNAGTDADFLGIVLHELGHGLGFSSYFDFASAEPLIVGTPDAFSTHTLDLDLRATWDTLTQTQLRSSFANARRVVWSGAHVSQAVPRYLVRGSPRIMVTPAVTGLSGMLSEHDDGPKLSDRPATGPLVVPTPASGCTRPTNAAALKGAIALIDSGSSCHPLEAVAYMEEAGAAAVIAVDPEEVWPPAMINGILEGQVIPVVTIHRDDAALLTAQAVGRSVTLDGDATTYVGADAAGRPFLNATDPVVDGTSISHWDALARNQLLMEPERSAHHLDVDLTREFMWDLGWPICGDGVIQGIEACDDANRIDTDTCHNDCTSASSTVVGTGGTTGTTKTPTTDPKATSDAPGGDKVSCSCQFPSSRMRRDGLGAILALILLLRITRKRTPFGI